MRQTERLVRKMQRQKDAPPAPKTKDVDTAALERDLMNLLGLKVTVKFKNDGASRPAPERKPRPKLTVGLSKMPQKRKIG